EHTSTIDSLALLSTVVENNSPGTPKHRDHFGSPLFMEDTPGQTGHLFGLPYNLGILDQILGLLEGTSTAFTTWMNIRAILNLATGLLMNSRNVQNPPTFFISILQGATIHGAGKEAMGKYGDVLIISLGLSAKLKELRKSLRTWNKDIFGNVFQNLKEAEYKANSAQDKFEQNSNPENLVEFNKANAELLLQSKRETEGGTQMD
ncbi:unnamed protein product, partial [Cuscuta campestris]